MSKISDAKLSRGIGRHESYIGQLKARGKRELAEWLHSIGIDEYLEMEARAEEELKKIKLLPGRSFQKEFGRKAQIYRQTARDILSGGRMKPHTVFNLAKHFGWAKQEKK